MPVRSGGSTMSLASQSSCCCAFLCDDVGQVVQDFGEQRPGSGESISARSLVGLIERRTLLDFLNTVHMRGAALGLETKIHYGGYRRRLLLHGFQTPRGILIFAPVVPSSAKPPLTVKPANTVAVADSSAKGEEDTANLLLEVAHDLQNPISSIISACEYLAAYSQENADRAQLEMIAGIESAAATLLKLSDRISSLGTAINHRAAQYSRETK